MDSLSKELHDRFILKGERLRKGDPHLIAGRGGDGGRGRTEADDLRSKFEQPLRDAADAGAGESLLSKAESEAMQLMDQARQDAERLLAEARAQAAQITADAQAEATQMREQLEPGLRAELDEDFRGRYAAGLQAIGDAADALAEARTELLASLELPAFEMMQSIARQLLLAEIDRSPQFITGLISRGLGLLNEGREISLRLHPEIHELVNTDPQMSEAIREGSRRGQQLSIEPDSQLDKAAFRLLTEGSEVAFNLDDSLRELDEILAQQLFPVDNAVRTTGDASG